MICNGTYPPPTITYQGNMAPLDHEYSLLWGFSERAIRDGKSIGMLRKLCWPPKYSIEYIYMNIL